MTKTNDALDANIDKMLMWNINGHTEPVVFQPEMKAAIKKLIIADRKRLIERLETEAVGKGCTHKGNQLCDVQNRLKSKIRQRFDTIKQEELEGGGE